jgi:hypothetical protein
MILGKNPATHRSLVANHNPVQVLRRDARAIGLGMVEGLHSDRTTPRKKRLRAQMGGWLIGPIRTNSKERHAAESIGHTTPSISASDGMPRLYRTVAGWRFGSNGDAVRLHGCATLVVRCRR